MRHSFCGARSGIPALLLFLLVGVCSSAAQRRPQTPPPTGPWMNTSLSPDERADLVLKEMTLDEKVALLHGVGMPTDDPVTPENAPSNRGVGYAVGVPRLGIPGIDMSDAA
jgi:beta-glucosidase